MPTRIIHIRHPKVPYGLARCGSKLILIITLLLTALGTDFLNLQFLSRFKVESILKVDDYMAVR